MINNQLVEITFINCDYNYTFPALKGFLTDFAEAETTFEFTFYGNNENHNNNLFLSFLIDHYKSVIIEGNRFAGDTDTIYKINLEEFSRFGFEYSFKFIEQ